MPAPPPVILSQSPYTSGMVIAGKYELRRVLGEGGMGAVWEARNTALEVDVALKLIRAELNRETFGLRLRQEARAAAKLGHPAIVRVFDVGETSLGDPFIVMELLKGRSLGDLLALSGPLPPQRAVQLLLPIVDALVVAHAKGIVHRDLKPDNVFVAHEDTGEQPKLLDFGIVKVDQNEGESHLTQVGTVLGSPDYMSPEQARGAEDIDHRIDIWSFCVTLYEAVTGYVPFEAPNYNALLRTIVEDEPKPTTERGAPDEALWQIIRVGLSKPRDARWQSMTQLGKALAEWLVARGVYEDACGASLETRWLARNTDPQNRPARPSFASISGVSASGSQRGSLPSFPSPEPVSHGAVVRSVTAAVTVSRVRSRWLPWWPVAAGAGLLALALALAFSLGEREPAPVATPTETENPHAAVTATVAEAPEAERPAARADGTTSAATAGAPVVSASALPKEPTPKKKARSAKAPRAAAPAASKPAARPAKGASHSDLISPY